MADPLRDEMMQREMKTKFQQGQAGQFAATDADKMLAFDPSTSGTATMQDDNSMTWTAPGYKGPGDGMPPPVAGGSGGQQPPPQSELSTFLGGQRNPGGGMPMPPPAAHQMRPAFEEPGAPLAGDPIQLQQAQQRARMQQRQPFGGRAPGVGTQRPQDEQMFLQDLMRRYGR